MRNIYTLKIFVLAILTILLSYCKKDKGDNTNNKELLNTKSMLEANGGMWKLGGNVLTFFDKDNNLLMTAIETKPIYWKFVSDNPTTLDGLKVNVYVGLNDPNTVRTTNYSISYQDGVTYFTKDGVTSKIQILNSTILKMTAYNASPYAFNLGFVPKTSDHVTALDSLIKYQQ